MRLLRLFMRAIAYAAAIAIASSALLTPSCFAQSGTPAARQEQNKAFAKINWRRIEADNGAVYALDMNSISHNTNGSAVAVMCTVDNDTCIPPNMSRLLFDCHGHYMDIDRGGSAMLIAAPRSVVGKMADLACAGAKDTRFSDDSDHPDVSGTTPREYCQGFTPDACARVTAMVNGQTKMPPCKAGFAVVGSGYTPEQIRACSVKRTLRDAEAPTLVKASQTPAGAKPGETVIGQWSGNGNGKSEGFHVGPEPWEFRVSSSDYISGGIYRASDQTGVYNFGYTDGEQRKNLTSTGDVYFVVKSAGSWTITVISAARPQLSTACTRERAAEIARTGTANDPCLLHWRSIEVRQHPERATQLECMGLKAYEDPQPAGHPISLADCDRIAREDQQRFGLPAKGLSDEQKASYRRTWGQ